MVTRAIAEEGRHHRESAASIRLKAQRLRRALDADRLDDAVRVAADVAAELRAPSTAQLAPKAYYDVYLSVCAELRVLEMYAMETARRGAPVLELYERVQETPLVLPRLYLLVTAGSVYVKSQQAPAKDVLRDLVEMCSAVQHPQRGLFLRAYLAQMMKDKLPDRPAADADVDPWRSSASFASANPTSPTSEMTNAGAPSAGSLSDSLDFVLRNFTEMNRLWVRMKSNAQPQEEEDMQTERLELRLLVGSNFATLGRLLSNDMTLYTTKVLPVLIEQIVTCRDAIAQEYLADCVVQVFPDDFQLASLDAFLAMCAQLVRGVNLRTVLVSIIDRLTRYAKTSAAAADHVRATDAFLVFHQHFPAMLERQRNTLSLPDRLHIFLALMRFALELEPTKTTPVDAVLALAVQSTHLFVEAKDTGKIEAVNGGFPYSHTGTTTSNGGSGKNTKVPALPLRSSLMDEEKHLIVELLTMPLEQYQDVTLALRLDNFVVLQHLLSFDLQHSLAASVLRSVRAYTPCIDSVQQLEKLFLYVKPLVVGPVSADMAEVEDPNSESYSPAALFNPATLSSHHAYLAAAVSLGTYNAATISAGPPGVDADAVSESAASGVAVVAGAVDPKQDALQQQAFQQSQELVARIVFLVHSESLQSTVSLFEVIRTHLLRGDVKRRAITLPPLVMAALRLALRAGDTLGGEHASSGSVSPTGILMFAVECVDALVEEDALLALRLHTQIAVAADAVGTAADVVYDSLSRAYLLFENSVVTASAQFVGLELIIVALAQTRPGLPGEAYAALAHRAVKHAQHLLSKSDQTLMLLACAGLYRGARGGDWAQADSSSSADDEGRAVACVDRAVEAADGVAAVAERFFLLVAAANRIMQLVEAGCTAVAAKDRLRDVLFALRDAVAPRQMKNVPLGRAALRRRGLILTHIRAHPNVFSFLNVQEL